MKEATNTQKHTKVLRTAPREPPTQLQGVLFRSKRNQSPIFVDRGDEEYQDDRSNIRIGEEAERKNVDVTTAINRISPQNTDNDAQQEPSHATSAKKSRFLKRLVGENSCHGGQPVELTQGDEPFDEEDTPSDGVGSQTTANSVGFVKRDHHSWS